MFCWETAMTLPTIIVRTDNTQKSSVQSGISKLNDVMYTRRITANPATLGPTDIKAVNGVGAPSYTSGVHM